MGAEIIVSPSAWSVLSTNNPNDTADFINCWRAFNITRAAENLVCFVTSNLAGSGNAYLYSIGNSMIVNPEGKILYNAQNNECAHCQSVDLELIRRLKKEYPIYNLDWFLLCINDEINAATIKARPKSPVTTSGTSLIVEKSIIKESAPIAQCAPCSR